MLTNSPEYWKPRITALMDMIQETKAMSPTEALCDVLEGLPEKYPNGFPPLFRLLLEHEVVVLNSAAEGVDNLQEFAEAALNFFYKGFFGQPPRLEPSGLYTPPVVLRTLIANLSRDLELFQRGLHQRQLVNDELSLHLALLAIADRLAAAALQPAFNAGYLSRGIAATHLGDDFNVRLIPYYEMLLVEMPFTAGNLDQPQPTSEQLAIVHEVGHHVFQFGIVPDTRMTFKDYLTHDLNDEGITGGVANWLEELFADTYGLLVAGPVMALGFQETLSQRSGAYMTEDTGEHPIPLLRPLVQNLTLRLMTGGDEQGPQLYTRAPELLDQSWLRFSSMDILNQDFEVNGVKEPISGAVILQGLEPILRKILRALGGLRAHAAKRAWTGDLNGKQPLSTLIEQLKKADFLAALGTPEQYAGDVLSRRAEEFRRLADTNLRVKDWLPLFLTEGWGTEFGIKDMPTKIQPPKQ